MLIEQITYVLHPGKAPALVAAYEQEGAARSRYAGVKCCTVRAAPLVVTSAHGALRRLVKHKRMSAIGKSGRDSGDRVSVRGRDASYLAPPAQIRTCPIRAYGSHLGCVTALRVIPASCRMRFSACDTVSRYWARPVLC